MDGFDDDPLLKIRFPSFHDTFEFEGICGLIGISGELKFNESRKTALADLELFILIAKRTDFKRV